MPGMLTYTSMASHSTKNWTFVDCLSDRAKSRVSPPYRAGKWLLMLKSANTYVPQQPIQCIKMYSISDRRNDPNPYCK